jgi:hypothetical protein
MCDCAITHYSHNGATIVHDPCHNTFMLMRQISAAEATKLLREWGYSTPPHTCSCGKCERRHLANMKLRYEHK